MSEPAVIAMAPEHIPAVVGLHRRVLGDTLNARLGARHLTRLYKKVLGSRHAQAWVAVNASGRVAGFITVTRDLHALERSISRSMNIHQLVSGAFFLLRHPGVIKEIVDRNRFTRYLKKRYPTVFPAILTLGVDPETQKGGFGSALVRVAEKSCAAEKLTVLYVDTKEDNSGARRFYEKIGFTQMAVIVGNVLFAKPLAG